MAKFIFSECNARQKKAWKNIKYALNDFVGGLENALMDAEKDSEEYQRAKNTLADREYLVATIYKMAITDIYVDGACYFGPQAETYLKDIRFCGKEWMTRLISAMLKKQGY